MSKNRAAVVLGKGVDGVNLWVGIPRQLRARRAFHVYIFARCAARPRPIKVKREYPKARFRVRRHVPGVPGEERPRSISVCLIGGELPCGHVGLGVTFAKCFRRSCSPRCQLTVRSSIVRCFFPRHQFVPGGLFDRHLERCSIVRSQFRPTKVSLCREGVRGVGGNHVRARPVR